MEAVGVGRRAVAILIDMVVLFIVGYLIALATGATTSAGFNLQGGPAFLWFGVALAYYVVMEATSGATLGKRAMGLKVVKEGGEPLDWQASIVRNILRIVDGLFFYLVGAIAVWVSKKRQRLGDMAAHTIVVSARVLIACVAALALGGLHAPESAAATPGYTDIVVSDAKDGKAASTFKVQTGKVFLRARISGVVAGSSVRSDWIAVKTPVAPPNYKIDSVTLKVGPLANRVDFSLNKPDAGWPEGDYRVALFIDDKPAGEARFRVVK